MIAQLKSNSLTFTLAGVSIALYAIFAYDLDRSDFYKLLFLFVILFACTWHIVERGKTSFWVLAALGVVFRLLFTGAIPNLSQDFYRFLWDGRLLVQGISPYLITPEAYLANGQEIVPQAQELYAGMGELNGSHFSNYPPVNQLCFALAALFSGKSILGSVVVSRAIIILADIGILYFGKKILERLKLPVNNIFWYFLNPFIIIELTGNLHFESVMLFFLIWALYLLFKGKWAWAAILIGISISVKLIPLLLLPVFFKWFVKKESITVGLRNLTGFYLIVLATVAISFLPFLSPEFTGNFSKTIGLWFQNFEFNASVYYVIRWIGYETVGWNIIGIVGKILPVVVIAIILALSFFRNNRDPKRLLTALLFAICAYFLLSTTVHPWYVATPLLIGVLTRFKFPIIWSSLVMLSYAAYSQPEFSENLLFVAVEYSIVIAVLIWELRQKPKLQHVEEG